MNPTYLNEILKKATELKYTLSCDSQTGQLLRVLANSKRAGKFLELGTGAGASTAWILDGMYESSNLISVEMDESIQNIAKSVINDGRVQFIAADAAVYIKESAEQKFDFIFADTWPGKFYLLEETLSKLNPGGIYIIDDLKVVSSWPEEHVEKVRDLISTMRGLEKFEIVELDWSTGLIIATRS